MRLAQAIQQSKDGREARLGRPLLGATSCVLVHQVHPRCLLCWGGLRGAVSKPNSRSSQQAPVDNKYRVPRCIRSDIVPVLCALYSVGIWMWPQVGLLVCTSPA